MSYSVLLVCASVLQVGATAAVAPPRKGVEVPEWYDDGGELAEWLGKLQYLTMEPEEIEALEAEPLENLLRTCAGWTADMLCAGVFLAGLPEAVAFEQDVGILPRNLVAYPTVDYEAQTVEVQCSVLAPILNPDGKKMKSIYRPGIGCTFIEPPWTEEQVRAIDLGDAGYMEPQDPTVKWPEGDAEISPSDIPSNVDIECIQAVSQSQFDKDWPDINPRAITVAYKGKLIFEQYATQHNVTRHTKVLGWSATKTVTQSVLSLAVGAGNLDVFAPAPVPEWNVDPDDARAPITPDMMLRMSSGTEWAPGDILPTTECLFYSEGDCAHNVAVTKPLVDPEPDTRDTYNSGSTYILSRIALEKRANPEMTPYEYVRKRFFDRFNARSFTLQFQPNGAFLGGGYGYATGRDWARFGLLHVRDGVWNGDRIMPEGWVDYSRTPSKNNANYGAHMRFNEGIADDLWYGSGFRDQHIYMFGDKDLVISRNSMPPLLWFGFNNGEFLNDMLSCFNFEK